MSEMIERVARAIWEEEFQEPVDYHTQEITRDQARAAIEAMRVPTKEMKEAGINTGVGLGPITSAAIWQAMIDEALK